jgi:hypothetical protein
MHFLPQNGRFLRGFRSENGHKRDFSIENREKMGGNGSKMLKCG